MKTEQECREYLIQLEKSASSAKGYAYVEMLRWVLDMPTKNDKAEREA